MRRAINVKSTHAPGFSKGSGSARGKKTLGFFGLRGSVSFSVSLFIDFGFDYSNLQRGAVKAFCGESPLPERSNISGIKNLSSQFLDYRSTSKGN